VSVADNILLTNGLTKRFGGFVAVRDLDLEVRRGEIYGFLGPNGAGKSTTIRILLGLIRPSRGSGQIFGLDIRRHGTTIRRRLGYLPGELALYENLSPRQLFEYSAALYGVDDLGYAIELSERLKVKSLDEKIGSLSQGNKQKVGLVQALLHRPELAILDEPTNGLDPLIRHELYAILEEARERGTTVFFSSHVLAEAERLCDRVAIIRDGELTRVGTVDELKAIAPRRMRITFEDGIPAEAFAAVPGVAAVNVDGRRAVELLVRSNMDEIVKLAARYPVSDFYSEDVSLEEIFLGYYDTGPANGTINGISTHARPVDERPRAAVAVRHADGESEDLPHHDA
jgi:ABC-2 type transport system ATP-binding protein